MNAPKLFRSALFTAATILVFTAVPTQAQRTPDERETAPAVPLQAFSNGGFESGAFDVWTVNDPTGFYGIGTNPAFGHSGVRYAYLGADTVVGTLSQTFSTSATEMYQLSFWLATDTVAAVNTFEIFWNGVSVLTLTNLPTQNYINYTISNLPSGGSTSSLSFHYKHSDDYFRLDDVSVSVVPEPSTVALALFGLGLVAVVGYRRRVRV